MCSVFFYFFVSFSFLNTSLPHLKVFVSLLYFSSPNPCTPIPTHAVPASTPPVPFLEPPSYTGSPTTPDSSFPCPYASHVGYFHTVQMETARSSEMVNFLQTTWCYIPEDRNIDSVIHKQCELN